MTIKYIHVNQHIIRSNKKNNANEPVLSCGARVVIKTEAEVTID